MRGRTTGLVLAALLAVGGTAEPRPQLGPAARRVAVQADPLPNGTTPTPPEAPATAPPSDDPPATAEPTPDAAAEPTEATPRPPAGPYYGNSLPGSFGGRAHTESVLTDRPGQTGSLFAAGRRRRNLQFSGYWDLGLTLRSVSGASATFSSDQFSRDKLFSQNASLLVAGPFWKWANLNVHAQVEQRAFGFNDTQPVWRVFWEDSNNRVTLGDISPTLGDANEFVPFSRRLKGLEARGRLPGSMEYLVFASQVEGSIRTETFVGDGTPGPYFLTFTPIVDGSAIVVLDGVVQQAGYGDTGDYTLNPSSGELMFNGSRIIPPTSRIEVRYETTGRSGPKDLLVGTRLSSTPLRGFNIGLSYLGQIASDDGSLDGPVERRVSDELVVPTPSSGPFTIRPRPLVPESESVQVNGVLQVRDVDYEIAYETGELRFFRILPEGTNILVRFSVIEEVDLGSGDRSVWGLDGSYTINANMAVQFEVARSSGTPAQGSNPFSFTSGSGSYGSGSYGGGFGSGGFDSGGFGSGGFSDGFGTGSGAGSGATFFRAHEDWARREVSWSGRRYAGMSDPRSRQDGGSQASRGAGGSAYKVSFGSRWGGFTLGAQYKAVSDQFSRIDSTSFYQNERGIAMQAQYTTGRRFTVSHQLHSFSRPYSVTDSEGEVTDSRVTSALNLTTLQWRVTPDSNLTLTRQSQDNSGGGSANILTRHGLQFQHRFGTAIQFTGSLDQASTTTSGVVTSLGSSVSNNSDTFAGRFGVGYSTSGGKFTTRLDYSFSGTESATSKNDATSTNLSLTYQPFRWGSMQFSRQISSSKNRSLVSRGVTGSERVMATDDWGTPAWWRYDRLRRQAGTGVFGDDGSSQGNTPTDPLTGGNLTTNITDSDNRNTTLALLFTPMRRLSINTTFSFSGTDNGRLAGSKSNSWQTNLHWQVSSQIGMGFGYSTQSLRYTDTGDTTDTGIFNLNFDWRLSRHLDLRFDYQTMSTSNAFGPREEGEPDPVSLGLGGGSDFNSWGLDLRWKIPGTSGQNLFANFRGDSSRGGAGSGDFGRLQLQTGWNTSLTDILGLQLSYDFTNYDDRSNNETAGDRGYAAHIFTASVGARF